MIDVLPLTVQTPRREVLRYMGYPRSRQPSPAVSKKLEALWPLATSLVHARGAFLLVDRTQAEAVGVPSPTDHVALCVCTLGDDLEEHDSRLSQQGDVLGGFILDAFGSAAAEACAEGLHARVCATVQPDHLSAHRRISPGYGNWNVARQVELLALLPLDRLGMSLTPGCMMVPRKSVSFAVLLGAHEEHRPRARCAACDKLDCCYRIEETHG